MAARTPPKRSPPPPAPASAPPAIASPLPGAMTGPRPAFAGAAEPGATVTVWDGATPVCSALADGAGDWSCAPSLDLPIATYLVTATAVDLLGNPESLPSAAVSFEVVAPPVVTLGALATITSANAGAYTVAGTCSDAWTVNVAVGTASTTTACASDAFSVSFGVAAVTDASSVTVSASQTNAAGVTGGDTANVLKDTVSAPPVISAPLASAETGRRPAFSGSAEAGALVTVSDAGGVLCSTTATGVAWSCSPSADLPVGADTVWATAVDTLSNPASVASDSVTFTVVAPPVVTLTAPAVIFSGNAGNYAVSGTCSGSYTVNISVGSASTAVACGASIVNDISGLGYDRNLGDVAAHQRDIGRADPPQRRSAILRSHRKGPAR